MIDVLIGIIVLLIAGLVTVKRADYDSFSELMGGVMVFCGGVGLITYTVMVYFYVASQYQADILNREYGTTYTQTEVFFASDVIEKIRELDRKRIEVNGDVITGK